MTAYDRRGAEIKAGSFVIWHDNCANNASGLYLVLAVKKKVRLQRDGYNTWVFPDSVIVVDSVPYVEGKFNTKEKEKNEQPANPVNPRAARKR